MTDKQQRAEIRKLVEQIQKAVAARKLSFGAELIVGSENKLNGNRRLR